MPRAAGEKQKNEKHISVRGLDLPFLCTSALQVKEKNTDRSFTNNNQSLSHCLSE